MNSEAVLAHFISAYLTQKIFHRATLTTGVYRREERVAFAGARQYAIPYHAAIPVTLLRLPMTDALSREIERQAGALI
ncbi:hypothetical protein ACOBQX_20360 [Actinokineospora sp. G85]|uniref:hypothetical protein n=1 Tax=Actinokineospora sp. G85 TaxID=3406626 RepID=UPI003C792287